jgi:hypothetical protein
MKNTTNDLRAAYDAVDSRDHYDADAVESSIEAWHDLAFFEDDNGSEIKIIGTIESVLHQDDAGDVIN